MAIVSNKPPSSSPIVSIQTGYVNTTTSTSTAEDLTYVDVTISAVTVANCVVEFEGAGGATDGFTGMYDGPNTANHIVTKRITSTTNLRLSCPSKNGSAAAAARITGRWTVTEYA